MIVKCMQNIHENVQLEWVKNSKLFHKRDASIPPHSNLKNKNKYQKVTKTKHQDKFHKYKKSKPNKHI